MSVDDEPNDTGLTPLKGKCGGLFPWQYDTGNRKRCKQREGREKEKCRYRRAEGEPHCLRFSAEVA